MTKKRASAKKISTKQNKILQNLTRVILQFMAGRGFAPLSFRELVERLHIPQQHEEGLLAALDELVRLGELELKGGRYGPKKAHLDTVAGILRVHPRGFGFLQPEDATAHPQDIFIPRNLTQNAVDGDRVEILINQEGFSEKGPEGRVVAILERNRTHIAGTIRSINPNGEPIAHVPLLGISQQVVIEPSRDFSLGVGDRIVMEVLEWGNASQPTTARVSHVIGHITDPKCDVPAATEEFDLRSEFPAAAVAEAESYGTRVSTAALSNREDLRSLTCVTIDPDTAKDYDDAISLSKDAKGNYHLGVHIADVSFYVQPGTALDQEAALRCNSTYFPGVCLPMLPPGLSENLCSLKPHVNRLAASVLVTLAPDGSVSDYRITRSVIKSSKRFTYSQAKEVLDGKHNSPFAPMLHLMVELCERLKRKRYERGSIEFSLPDLVVVINPETGMPEKTSVVEYDITHQMVEEFMLKANEIVALHLSEKGEGLTYRVHEEPAEDSIREFAQLAAAFGFRLSDKPTPEELQKLFQEAVHTPYGAYLATSFIRSMRLAIYSAENIGHYGLRLSHYCHFTSPIRRYIDLVIHRILFGDSHAREQLMAIAKHCSEQERLSAKAEGNVVLLKKLRLIQQLHKKDPYREYAAIITRVKPFGFFFEVLEFMLEGFVHVSQLGSDFFVYEESRRRLCGRRTGHLYSSADRITVMLKGVDLILLESSWEFIDDADREEGSTHRSPAQVQQKRRKLKPTRGRATKPSKPKKTQKKRKQR